jgi:hypothetical protein
LAELVACWLFQVFYSGWTPDYPLDMNHRDGRAEALGVLAAQEARTRLGPELKAAEDNVRKLLGWR